MAVSTNPSTASLPNGIAVTVGTANQLAIPYNGGRGGLILYNNSASAVIAVCPASLTSIAQGTAPASPGQSSFAQGTTTGPTLGVAVINGPGSITLQPGGQAFIIDNLNCAGAWNAIASANGAALTVLEF
jgi:hypothetical protein